MSNEQTNQHALLDKIKRDSQTVLSEFIEKSQLSSGKLLVIGCSTSEVIGSQIGTNSSVDAAGVLWDTIHPILKTQEIHVAIQCCEHLNRALVVERDFARSNRLEIVSAIPHPKAGGAFATAAYNGLNDPVLVENLSPINADAGLDIGGTLIGMHIRAVAVPIKLENNRIGDAGISGGFYRPKYVGGPRAQYI